MENLMLDEQKIRTAFVLAIVNTDFEYRARRNGANADKKNIKEFCSEMNYTINDISGISLKDSQISRLKFDHKGLLRTDNLKAQEMKDLFQIIATGDFSSYDAFICFISSHGDEGGIFGYDDRSVPVKFITDQFKATDEYQSLVGKPKLFFTQNCRGSLKNEGRFVQHDGGDENNGGDEADSGCKIPITIPTGADVLVAYSTVDGYESYRNNEMGSWFIIILIQVLKNHAHSLNLTDMLAIVNEAVGRREYMNGKKQMPCFTSTLRKAVRFEIKPPAVQPLCSQQL